jgi:hypothetical protein
MEWSPEITIQTITVSQEQAGEHHHRVPTLVRYKQRLHLITSGSGSFTHAIYDDNEAQGPPDVRKWSQFLHIPFDPSAGVGAQGFPRPHAVGDHDGKIHLVYTDHENQMYDSFFDDNEAQGPPDVRKWSVSSKIPGLQDINPKTFLN